MLCSCIGLPSVEPGCEVYNDALVLKLLFQCELVSAWASRLIDAEAETIVCLFNSVVVVINTLLQWMLRLWN